MIQFEDVSVTFQSKEKKIDAVKNVSFSINDGDICGIVGTSGAGKSTLLRTINQLQKPTEGNVLVDGEDISKLDGKELRKARLGIGMIFQQFNLIGSKTISENIAFAMEVAGKSEKEIKKRVPELLKLVGLTDRANSYPSQLSGGQKQRVGIARGVANNPRILLCDEPTSALDPETTNAILVLLKEINQKI
ncbi:MAG TPA: ATP-binding cassette domain-containing protein, partial [Paludibacteraceae bacterium]|nr:ATP-binding cassette domain-containing protein [Paludibacteraceae bacterium]